ncbi:DUF6691 family protein [Jannaschia sp. M317]|uniref:DUF6691 family protein n=1 Tax=Jannaschia sp. M317 TaxID=2867011 RepID=UPI0021A4AD1A|nr:DUF6691 family protein [Jannaschia sp. M317]UWQ16306.1 hypothetical protein K3551_10240 [Jannaschia sp. M317]
MRPLVAAAAGALFGGGLLVSGMTDTARVRGFLALLGPGPWDPTLAFVMGGAILPMLFAWRVTPRRAPVLAQSWPERVTGLDGPLIAGSVLFGIGWGLVGLCPGPALASLLWGGPKVAGFAAAMVLGMVALPRLRALRAA